MVCTDADRDLDDEVALDVDAQAQVQALARRLLEARRGGELVVLLRGGDAFERLCVTKDAGGRASNAVVTSAAASSAESTIGNGVVMPRTAIWPLYLPFCLRT